MATAICISCGRAKRSPLSRCASCGFVPEEDAAMAKSLILSVNRYEDGTQRARYRKELDAIGAQIANGEEYRFDEDEVDALVREKQILDEPLTVIETAKIVLAILGFLALPLIVLVFFLLIELILSL